MRLIVEKMTPGGWRLLRLLNEAHQNSKFKDENTSVCTYPFKATAAGDTKFDKDGNIKGYNHGKKK